MEAPHDSTSAAVPSVEGHLPAASKRSKPVDYFREVTYECTANASFALLLGAVLRSLNTPLAWPVLGYAAGLYCTRVPLEMSRRVGLLPQVTIEEIQQQVWESSKALGKSRSILALSAIILAIVAPLMTFLIGVVLGALSALTIDREHNANGQRTMGDTKDWSSWVKTLI